jgi:uncharacterized protein (UPF0335 family)
MIFFTKQMKAIDRLYIYLENQNIRPTTFEREIGLSSGYLSNMKKRSADMGESILNKVIENCHLLSAGWLLTGNGSMIKNSDEFAMSAKETVTNAELLDRIERLSAEKARLEDRVAQLLGEKKTEATYGYNVAAEPELKFKKK